IISRALLGFRYRSRSSQVRLLFFFQAEDGIRDFHVTGVQTCALPIFDSSDKVHTEIARLAGEGLFTEEELGTTCCFATQDKVWRSEERRVGKECRCGGSPYQ